MLSADCSDEKKACLAARPSTTLETWKLTAAEACRLHRLSRYICGRRNALHAQLEVVGVRGVLECRFVADQSGLEQIPQRLVERLHAVLRSAGRNRVADGAGLFRHENTFANERGVDHD